MIYSIPDLDKLANEKADDGCRPLLKAAANKYITCGDHSKIIEAYRIADTEGHLRSDLVLTMVSIIGGILFFNKSPESVWEIVREMVPPVKGKLPSTTLQKMVALRIKELIKMVRYQNQSYINTYNWQAEDAKKGGKPLPAYPTLIPEPDFKTLNELNHWLDNSPFPYKYEIERFAKKFRKQVLNKPELTDQDVAGGMNLVTMGLVMEE